MCSHDSAYFEQRAEEALDRAQHAVHPAAARAHYGLAELYLERMRACSAPASGGPLLSEH